MTECLAFVYSTYRCSFFVKTFNHSYLATTCGLTATSPTARPLTGCACSITTTQGRQQVRLQLSSLLGTGSSNVTRFWPRRENFHDLAKATAAVQPYTASSA